MTTQTQTQETVTHANTLFTSAEHFIAFRKNWSAFINSDESKSYKDDYGTKYKRINGAYFLLYALLRGRKGTECFATEDSFFEAKAELKSAINWKSSAAKFLAPYDGQVTMDMFKEAVSRCPDTYQEA